MAQVQPPKTSSSSPLTPTTSAPDTPPHARKHAHPNYIGIFVFLAVLTAAELTVAFLPWHKNVIVALLIGMALWKAALVGLYYMHLRFETRRIVILALGPLPLCVILVAAVATEFFW
jgi:caa(3)-type oxidase subunit IV